MIETGKLLKREIQRKTENAPKIEQALKNAVYVDDQIVIDIVKKKISDCERDKKDWILEGFPRTKRQALALQQMGVIPDKII